MKTAVFASLCLMVLAATGCGVKAPPSPLALEEERIPPNLDCSPYDPDCDAIDENYTPKGGKPRSSKKGTAEAAETSKNTSPAPSKKKPSVR